MCAEMVLMLPGIQVLRKCKCITTNNEHSRTLETSFVLYFLNLLRDLLKVVFNFSCNLRHSRGVFRSLDLYLVRYSSMVTWYGQ